MRSYFLLPKHGENISPETRTRILSFVFGRKNKDHSHIYATRYDCVPKVGACRSMRSTSSMRGPREKEDAEDDDDDVDADEDDDDEEDEDWDLESALPPPPRREGCVCVRFHTSQQ